MVKVWIPPEDVHEPWSYRRAAALTAVKWLWATVAGAFGVFAGLTVLAGAIQGERVQVGSFRVIALAVLFGALVALIVALAKQGERQRAAIKALIDNKNARHWERLAQYADNLKDIGRAASKQNLGEKVAFAETVVLTVTTLGGFDRPARPHIKARVLLAHRDRKSVVEAALAALLSPVAVAHPITDPDVFKRGCDELAAEIECTIYEEGWRRG